MGSLGNTSHRNRLADQASPYLLQHAHNPVDWWPWCEEAFEAARAANKPIFLSIGYSTCHWCHVMERESFENEEIAALLNQHMICIKVDREERPDIDQVYMAALQMSSGSGGWPMSAFLDHDGRPFFLGTYFPPEDRYGRPGFPRLIQQIAEAWKEQPDEIARAGKQFQDSLVALSTSPADEVPAPELQTRCLSSLQTRFDKEHGGFSGGRTKFPTPHVYSWLLRHGHVSKNPAVHRMVFISLEQMAFGGIYDHVGGGFHRYSTDQEWHLPHFEKMLYDQAQLAIAFCEALQVSKDEQFADVARGIFSYVSRDLRGDNGGFLSAEDADSLSESGEMEEGLFYTFTRDELDLVLGETDGAFLSSLYGCKLEGNFRDEATGVLSGRNVLHYSPASIRSTATMSIGNREDFRSRVGPLLEKLFWYREGRERPLRDDKVLTSWNGLMIQALALGSRVLKDPGLAETAERCVTFLKSTMRTQEGHLLHSWRNGVPGSTGFLDDYAFLARGLLELYTTTWNLNHLEWAVELADQMLARFEDEDNGGFFFTPFDGEELIVRRKDIYDGAEPSGNSVAADVLQRLGTLLGRDNYLRAAEGVFKVFHRELNQNPGTNTAAMVALDLSQRGSQELVVAIAEGKPVPDKLNELTAGWNPYLLCLLRREEEAGRLAELAPYTKGMGTVDGQSMAYLCREQACEKPVKLVSLRLP